MSNMPPPQQGGPSLPPQQQAPHQQAYHQVPTYQQPSYQPPKGYKLKKKRRWPWVLLGIIVVFVVIAAIGAATQEDEPSDDAAPAADDPGTEPIADDGSEAQSAPDQTAAPAVLGVGGTDDTADLDVTLISVQDPFIPTNEFERPSDGNRFVAVELNLVNNDDEVETFSTILLMELIDSLGQRWNITIAGTDLPQLDGDVPPGSNRRGWAVFEIPNESTGLRLNVKGDLMADGVTFTF